MRYLLAGLWLAAVEVTLVACTAWALFLGHVERSRYALTTALVLPVGVWLAAQLGRGALAVADRASTQRRAARVLQAIALLSVGPSAALVLWWLTAGRRVRDLPVRAPAVAVGALAAGVLAAYGATWLRDAHARPARRRVVFGACLSLAMVGVLVDRLAFPRGYPAFHGTLACLAVTASACAGAFMDTRGLRIRLGRMPGAARWRVWWARHPGAWPERAALGLWVLAAAVLGWGMLHAPNLRFVLSEQAPLTGKLIALGRPWLGGTPGAVDPGQQPTAAAPEMAAAPGIDLRGRDVLLITVDALRADQLGAYGGSGPTPELDRLAAESAVFERAYTPTPHTSYALTSLMTGKYLRPVMTLPDAPSEHTFVTDLLRRYGYRTAAFYPPAIFYVDAERFTGLAETGLGFEYRKAMFASAADRVGQLATYLREVDAARPVFAWVHLFEPHEPYDPPPRFRHGSSARALYAGEVEASDAAIGELVRVFREARPGGTVVVTADHGEEFGDHGGYYHGSTLYEEQVRVPLLWSSPNVVEPRRVAVPVETIDVTTTLLAALGIPRDARMRGDDLGPVLRGAQGAGPRHAFADLADARMVTDGRFKAICPLADPDCALFDLVEDPGERRNLASAEPARLRALRTALGELAASIPQVEAMALGGQSAWPEVLSRAQLGDPSVGPQLVPLLGAARPQIRAAAIRAVATRGYRPALAVIERLARDDTASAVRREASLAAYALRCAPPGPCAPEDAAFARVVAELVAGGQDGGGPQLDAAQPSGSELQQRAALALAARGDASGAGILTAMLEAEGLEEQTRRAAVEALAGLGQRSAVPALVRMLDEVRLRPVVAAALGRIGDRRAVPRLRELLEAERYVPVRSAEVRALLALGQTRAAVAAVHRYLGMPTGLPDGVGILMAQDALSSGRSLGAALPLAGALRTGRWRCDAGACQPREGAGLRLPAAAVARRLVLRVEASAEATALVLEGQHMALRPGVQELGLPLPPGGPRVVKLDPAPGVRVLAFVAVPARPEIPPPAPEPFDVPDAGAAKAQASAAVPSRAASAASAAAPVSADTRP